MYQQMDADEFFVLLVDQLEERVKAVGYSMVGWYDRCPYNCT